MYIYFRLKYFTYFIEHVASIFSLEVVHAMLTCKTGYVEQFYLKVRH